MAYPGCRCWHCRPGLYDEDGNYLYEESAEPDEPIIDRLAAAAPRTDEEWQALYEALDQYVDRSLDNANPHASPLLASALAVFERMNQHTAVDNTVDEEMIDADQA